MKQVTLEIDGQNVSIEEGKTLLEAAKQIGITIPTLCYHEKLAPYGACRLCLVEITRGKRSQLVASCAYYVENGLKVQTKSPRVIKIRKLLIELLLAISPYIPEVRNLAAEYDVKETRFKSWLSMCLLCGLCVRYCAEVKGKDAVGFVGRGIERQVTWVPDSAYAEKCADCFDCLSICPTGVFPSNWGLANVKQLNAA